MTAPTVRDTHHAWVATIPAADQTSTLTGDQDTVAVWPHNARWAVTFGLMPDDYLDLPLHIDGDVIP